jgi:hypothetical protein
MEDTGAGSERERVDLRTCLDVVARRQITAPEGNRTPVVQLVIGLCKQSIRD